MVAVLPMQALFVEPCENLGIKWESIALLNYAQGDIYFACSIIFHVIFCHGFSFASTAPSIGSASKHCSVLELILIYLCHNLTWHCP